MEANTYLDCQPIATFGIHIMKALTGPEEDKYDNY